MIVYHLKVIKWIWSIIYSKKMMKVIVFPISKVSKKNHPIANFITLKSILLTCYSNHSVMGTLSGWVVKHGCQWHFSQIILVKVVSCSTLARTLYLLCWKLPCIVPINAKLDILHLDLFLAYCIQTNAMVFQVRKCFLHQGITLHLI
jgi:hypothetical protein